jgi:hypothetical protein
MLFTLRNKNPAKKNNKQNAGIPVWDTELEYPDSELSQRRRFGLGCSELP